MTRSQELAVRASEHRTKLNELAAVDEPTAEQLAELESVRGAYASTEAQLRAAIMGESSGNGSAPTGDGGGGDGDGDGGTVDPPVELDRDGRDPKWVEQLRQVELRAYLESAMHGGSALSGAAAEVNQELELKPNQLPFELLDPALDEGSGRLEERADAATSAPATLPAGSDPILGRIFSRSVASWIGVRMPSVGIGKRQYPVLTGGTSASMKAKGAEVDAEAATFEVTEVSPTRLTARYLFRIEDLATFPGMEAALRRDLGSTMSDELDKQVISGNAAAPNFAGFFHNNTLAAPVEPTAQTDVAGYIGLVTGMVDGKIATMGNQIRLLIGPQTYRHAATQFLASTELAGLGAVQRTGGGVRVSDRVPVAAAVGGKLRQELLAIRGMGSVVCPMWPSITLIRDVYSGAAKGEVAITAVALHGFAMVRDDGFARLKVQLVA